MTYDLSMEEVRVLGALMEKETTTPDYYPLTLNGLINACNQKSNREPVVSFDERTVLGAIDNLRDRQFAFRVQLADSRVPKYEQSFVKELGLTIQEAGVMGVLLLRGPQTPGEIRSRSARLYPFETMDEVFVTLDTLLEREEGALVMRLHLQPGRKEARYAHLLSGEVEEAELEVVHESQPKQWRQSSTGRLDALEREVMTLREELAEVRRQFTEFKAQFE